MIEPGSRRRDFPSLEGRAYLNTAAEGIPPGTVIEALRQYGDDKLLGMDGRALHEKVFARTKERAAAALGLRADEIGICSCTSEAYNLAAIALGLKEGDEVVINDLDFPAGATAWLQPSCPATVKVWRSRDGVLRVEDLRPLLGPRTRFVTTSLVSFYNGFSVPLADVVHVVRKDSPALLAVDVTQALGRVQFDLADVDLIVSSTHKWILAAHGGGLVGVPSDRTEEWTVPAGGWFNLQDPFRDRSFESVRSKPGADSFSVGMPNYAAVYAAEAGLEYILDVGVESIERHAGPLVSACMEGLKKLDVDLLTPDEPDSLAGILAFRHESAEHLNELLRREEVHLMCHAGRLRVAIHGYNTGEDIEHFLKVLSSVLSRLGSA